MRWFLRLTVVLLVLLAAYAAWPLHGLYRLAAAVQARDAPALAERVDFERLRRSLSHQVIAAYLKLTGQDTRLGAFGMQVATGVGSNVADPILERLVTPESLLALLDRGRALEGEAGSAGTAVAPLGSNAISDVWRTWLESEYSGRDFYVSVPPERPAADRFRLHLRFTNWQWKLAGIDLPEALRMRLAEEVAKAAR
jgi:hypothetical protein